ncbi:MAG: helix-turn-helix domain-containing protein [Alphaproteobacteria bacterium]
MLISIDDLIRARVGLGWTQKELSQRSAIPQQTISIIERKTRKPRPITLQKLYKAFLDAGWDFGDTSNSFANFDISTHQENKILLNQTFSLNHVNELVSLLKDMATILSNTPIQHFSPRELQEIYSLSQQQYYILKSRIPENVINRTLADSKKREQLAQTTKQSINESEDTSYYDEQDD